MVKLFYVKVKFLSCMVYIKQRNFFTTLEQEILIHPIVQSGTYNWDSFIDDKEETFYIGRRTINTQTTHERIICNSGYSCHRNEKSPRDEGPYFICESMLNYSFSFLPSFLSYLLSVSSLSSYLTGTIVETYNDNLVRLESLRVSR